MEKLEYIRNLNFDARFHMKKPVYFLKPKIGRNGTSSIRHLIEKIFGGKHEFINIAMMYFEPSLSENFGNRKMAIWPDMKTRVKGEQKRMVGKPGRMFKRMFPFVTDQQVIKFTDLYLNEFSTDDLVLIESFEEKDFIKAYSHDIAETQNIYSSLFRKQLARSCMHGGFDHLPKHPSAVYASGDFKIVYTTIDDLIASRCVVRFVEDGDDEAGPIYGVSEASIDKIETHLKETGTKLENSYWNGARLQKIPYEDNYLMVYLDVAPSKLSDHGDYFVIDNFGEYEASDTSGMLNNVYAHCEACGEGLDEEDCHSTSFSDIYCRECFYERYFACSSCGEYECNDEMIEVNTSRYTEVVGNCCIDDYTMTSAGEFYENNLIIETEQGDIFNTKNETDLYFQSDLTGLYHNIDELNKYEDGNFASADELFDNGYIMNDEGIFEKNEDKESENIVLEHVA